MGLDGVMAFLGVIEASPGVATSRWQPFRMDSDPNVVRKLPLSVSISAAVHLAAVAWVAAREPSREDRAPAVEATTIEIVPAAREPEAVDVQLLDDLAIAKLEPSPPPAAKPSQPTRQRRRAVGGAAVSVGASTGIETPGREPAPGGPRSTYFDMRRGDRVDLTLPGGRYDPLDRPPAGTAPVAAVRPSGQLRDAAGGRKKSHQDVFVAKVERDGTVKLHDTRNLQAELSLNPARLLSGRFDINDYLMRRAKNDPYASRKLKFLDETRDERVALGKQWRQQQLMQTSQIMRKNLERAWNASPDIAAKKRALFELWDEIVEPDGSDELLAEASRTARRAVIGFIRARLPHDSEHAFTVSELVALNSRKQSRARFAPYE